MKSRGSCHLVLDSLHAGREKGRVWVESGGPYSASTRVL